MHIVREFEHLQDRQRRKVAAREGRQARFQEGQDQQVVKTLESTDLDGFQSAPSDTETLKTRDGAEAGVCDHGDVVTLDIEIQQVGRRRQLDSGDRGEGIHLEVELRRCQGENAVGDCRKFGVPTIDRSPVVLDDALSAR